MSVTVETLVANAKSRIREVAVADVPANLADDSVLVDVREPGEFAQGHIPGAVNIPRGVLEFKIHAHPAMACQADAALAQTDRPLLIYCLTGGRAALAADSLQQLGFSHVSSLAGGIQAWQQAGREVVVE